MTARLVGYTAVRDADGIVHSFGPGDDVPEWAAKAITNPKLWGGEVPPADDLDTGGTSPTAGAGTTSSAPVPPPKGGKGSGEDRWREYAAQVGVDVSEAQDRDDVITILELADVPTE